MDKCIGDEKMWEQWGQRAESGRILMTCAHFDGTSGSLGDRDEKALAMPCMECLFQKE